MATAAPPRTATSGSGGGSGGGAGGDGGGTTRTATLFACVVTLSNTLLGVSVVGVAGGFARAGSAVGTICLLLFACLSGCGLHLLARSSMTVSAAAKRKEDAKEEEAEEAGVGGRAGKEGSSKSPPPSSFRAVALVGAPRWAFLIDVSVALKCFGVATSYLVVIGDLMPTAMADILGDSHPDSILLSRHLWVTAGFFLAAPLAFSRTLGALKYTATLAIGLVVFLAAMVISFWLLPGLDACPDGGQTAVELMLEDGGDSGEDVGATGDGAGEYAARAILSSSLGGMLTPTPAAAAAVASGVESAEDVYGFPPGEGEGGAGNFDFEGGGGSANGGSCFEGSNIVASVRTILQTLPIFVFSFTCHQNIFTICNEIVRPTAARIDAVIVCAMLVATSTYLCMCWGAYATFGVGVEGDLLEAYPRTGLLTTARICVSMLVMSCYPLQAHPSRLCILSTWKAFSEDMHEAYSSLANGDEEAEPGAQRAAAAMPSTHTSQRRGNNASHGSGNSLSTTGGGEASSRSSSPDTFSGSSSAGGLRDGKGKGKGDGAPSDGERGRRRVGGGGTSRIGGGAGDRLLASPEREARREAELEVLLAGGAPPSRSSERSSSHGDVTLHQGPAGGEDEGDAVGVEPTDGMLAGTGGVAEKDGQRQDGQDEGEAFWATTEGFRHVLVTGAFLGLSYIIAMSLDDLGVLLEIVGATGSTTIAFILPGLLYLKVHPEPHPKRSLAALQLAVGLLIIPVALTFIALGDAAEGRR